MTRKAFVESQGATCRNWRWSWSFVNHDKKFVLFGAWDRHEGPNGNLIMSENWRTNARSGATNPGYSHAIEHLRLIEEHEYQLKTFPMIMANWEECAAGDEPARLGGIVTRTQDRILKKSGPDWFAV